MPIPKNSNNVNKYINIEIWCGVNTADAYLGFGKTQKFYTNVLTYLFV